MILNSIQDLIDFIASYPELDFRKVNDICFQSIGKRFMMHRTNLSAINWLNNYAEKYNHIQNDDFKPAFLDHNHPFDIKEINLM